MLRPLLALASLSLSLSLSHRDCAALDALAAASSAAPAQHASAPSPLASAPLERTPPTPAGYGFATATPPSVPFAQVPAAPVPGATLRVRRLPFTDAERVAEVNRTLDLIEQQGPFPYRQDGVVFFNREGRLPAQSTGYYREFTVRTPGAPTRGARRLVVGGNGEVYYTDDHYRSFAPIDPRRY